MKDEEIEKYDWGTIQWLINANNSPSKNLTFGVVKINPGCKNKPHIHPNCDEIVYVVSGKIEHTLDKKRVRMSAGDAILVPKGSAHHAINIGNEGVTLIVVYSTGSRQIKGVE